jgi:hypothetical protein
MYLTFYILVYLEINLTKEHKGRELASSLFTCGPPVRINLTVSCVCILLMRYAINYSVYFLQRAKESVAERYERSACRTFLLGARLMKADPSSIADHDQFTAFQYLNPYRHNTTHCRYLQWERKFCQRHV